MGGRGKEVEGRVDLSPLSPKVYREDYHTLNHFSLRAAVMILVCVARFERVGDKKRWLTIRASAWALNSEMQK